MTKDWEKLKEFFIHVFLFIDKSNVESITTWTLTLIIGIWIVILFLTWFLLWMVFKIVSCFK
ncbi:DUF2649 family protein [Spiroplasma endosymbiont of Megaselia nigra]|uniref:DUF2649 family protein n=1 Tax=Spiroplasma endosymbiont of Megaselia nigra TaxID=2478537 RepID=UPI000F87DD56|nr:DUF2649 family protein [Spiroplasma endosymbiont of Megaselia nigra]RUO86339.1 DUF2649 domain-containing protein [Spiroplasma endosymbiont of Megaselia nigra]